MKRLAGLLLLALAGCATVAPSPTPTPPNYVCVPAMTQSGQQVIYCTPHREAK